MIHAVTIKYKWRHNNARLRNFLLKSRKKATATWRQTGCTSQDKGATRVIRRLKTSIIIDETTGLHCSQTNKMDD